MDTEVIEKLSNTILEFKDELIQSSNVEDKIIELSIVFWKKFLPYLMPVLRFIDRRLIISEDREFNGIRKYLGHLDVSEPYLILDEHISHLEISKDIPGMVIVLTRTGTIKKLEYSFNISPLQDKYRKKVYTYS